MHDAFGVENPYIEKNWSGEPGDKRNTKYALAYGASPLFAGVPYTIYRQTDWGRKNRESSIKAKRAAKRKVKKSDSQRNTAAGVALGSALGAGAGGVYSVANFAASKENTRRAKGGMFDKGTFGTGGRTRVDIKGSKEQMSRSKAKYRQAQANVLDNRLGTAEERITRLNETTRQYGKDKRIYRSHVKGKANLISTAGKQHTRGKIGLGVTGGLAALSAGSLVAANALPRDKR